MKYLALIILLVSNTYAFNEEVVESIQENVQKQIEAGLASGAIIGLIDGDETRVLTLGYADLETRAPLTKDHYMSIGSVSKTYTSLLFSTAVLENIVSLDDKVSKYFPELSDVRAGDILLKDLSTHSSYLQRDPLNVREMTNPFDRFTLKEFLHEIRNAKYYPEDGKQNYSNLGSSLLGLCLERAYKRPFKELMEEKVFKALGLENIIVESSEGSVLLPKKYSSNLTEVPLWHNLGVMNPAGSFKATVGSMIKYIQAQLSESSEAITNSHETLASFESNDMAYGWFISKTAIGDLYSHTGSTAGFATEVYFSKKLNKGIVVLSNTNVSIQCVTRNFLFNSTKCDLKLPKAEPYEKLVKLAGTYSSKEGFVFYITASKSGFLTLRLKGQASSVRLEVQEDGSYLGIDVQLKVQFLEVDGNRLMQFKQNGYDILTIKVK